VTALGLGRRTLKTITHHSQSGQSAKSRAVIVHSHTERQTTKHTRRHTHKNPSLVLETVSGCRYHLGHFSLFHVFWPKVGGASSIGCNLLYMLFTFSWLSLNNLIFMCTVLSTG